MIFFFLKLQNKMPNKEFQNKNALKQTNHPKCMKIIKMIENYDSSLIVKHMFELLNNPCLYVFLISQKFLK